MSVKIMSVVWEHAPYSEGSLLVLLALADWSDDNGQAWPSVSRLAHKARLQRRRVQYIIRKLQADGFLEIEEGGGRKKQHKYTLNLEKLKGAFIAPFQNGALDDRETVHLGAERAHSATQTAHSGAPDPLEEPLEDPSLEPSEVELVLGFYKTHLNHPRTILTSERRKLINRRLREGYSSADLFTAIRGCKLSAFHQGENERGAIYDSIELIFKDAKHVETFMARAELGANGHNGNGNKPTASEKRVEQLKANMEFIASLADS